jgi:hypothetical protein
VLCNAAHATGFHDARGDPALTIRFAASGGIWQNGRLDHRPTLYPAVIRQF